MIPNKIALIVATAIIFWSSAVMAKRPVQPPPAPAPEVFSVKVEYSNNKIVVQGANLNSATVTLGGASVATDDAESTDTTVTIPFSEAVSDVVDNQGNYVLIIATDAGNFTLTAFIPFAIVYLPPGSGLCPCESDWDLFGSLSSPNGFKDIDPFCTFESDTDDFVTVQLYDGLAANYWVLWTEWLPSSGSGYCELWQDGPYRDLGSEAQFNACATYLRDTFVWPVVSNECLF